MQTENNCVQINPEIDVQVEEGYDFIADTLGRVLAVPRHAIIGTLDDFNADCSVDDLQSQIRNRALENTGLLVRLNHDATFDELSRVLGNERTAILTKALGVIATVPASFTSRFSRRNYYNPYSNTVVLYQPNSGIVSHELGHAEQFSSFDNPGLVAASQMIPWVGDLIKLCLEYDASRRVIDDLDIHEKEVLERSFYTYLAVFISKLLPVAGYLTFSVICMLGILFSKVEKRSTIFEADNILKQPQLKA